MKAEYLTACGSSDLCFIKQRKKKIGGNLSDYFFLTKWILITPSVYNQFYCPRYLTFKCFQNVFCKIAKTKDTNFRKLDHDWFNQEAWQGSIHYISVTAHFEWGIKVAYFRQPRSVIPIALQFTSWKSYAESLLKWEEKGQ